MRKGSVLALCSVFLLFFLIAVRMAPDNENAGPMPAGGIGAPSHSHQHPDEGKSRDAVMPAAMRAVMPQGTSLSVQEMLESGQKWKFLYMLPKPPSRRAYAQFLKESELSLLGARKG